MLHVATPLDHIYVHATLGTLEMDRIAQVILISFLQCPEKSFMTDERQSSSLVFLFRKHFIVLPDDPVERRKLGVNKKRKNHSST